MDPKFAPFVCVTANELDKEAPHISLEIEPPRSQGATLSITLPYTISMTLHRSDSHTRPLILRWDGRHSLWLGQFVILHESSSGLLRLEVPEMYTAKDSDLYKDPLDFYVNSCIKQLRPKGTWTSDEDLTDNYQELLRPGEKYHLFWPGGEIDMWEWGTMDEWRGKQLKVHSMKEGNLSKILVPASNVFSFTAMEEDAPWPGRAEMENYRNRYGNGYDMASINRRELAWRREQAPPPSPTVLGPETRVPGAPILTMKLEGPTEIRRKDCLIVKITLTYEPKDNTNENPRAFTFHNYKFEEYPSLGRFQCFRSGKWQGCKSTWLPGWCITDDPDVSINVSSSERFVSLRPGQEWTTETTVNDEDEDVYQYPTDTKAGDKFRFWYTGLELDWWDWGAKEDHLETSVKLNCSLLGGVVDPKDNNGRPKLIVPASNILEFTFIE